MPEEERRVTAAPEAGHALVATALPHIVPAHNITILPPVLVVAQPMILSSMTHQPVRPMTLKKLLLLHVPWLPNME